VDGCDNVERTRSYCLAHYKKVLKYGDPLAGYVQKSCKVTNCPERRGNDKGLCREHFNEWKRSQSIQPFLRVDHLFIEGKWAEFIEAIKSYCEVSDNNCWLWGRGRRNENGYGQIVVNKKDGLVHRYVMQASLQGKSLGKEQVHHICANRPCCNPDHLQLISQRENIAEMQQRNYYISRIKELEAEVAELKLQVREGQLFNMLEREWTS